MTSESPVPSIQCPEIVQEEEKLTGTAGTFLLNSGGGFVGFYSAELRV